MSSTPTWDLPQLEVEKRKHLDWLSRQPGFAGVGMGTGRDGGNCLLILTNSMPAETAQEVQRALAHVPLEFMEVGEFRAF